MDLEKSITELQIAKQNVEAKLIPYRQGIKRDNREYKALEDKYITLNDAIIELGLKRAEEIKANATIKKVEPVIEAPIEDVTNEDEPILTDEEKKAIHDINVVNEMELAKKNFDIEVENTKKDLGIEINEAIEDEKFINRKLEKAQTIEQLKHELAEANAKLEAIENEKNFKRASNVAPTEEKPTEENNK